MSDSSTAADQPRCPLSWPQQRWNLTLFALCVGMQYLAAPVLYVGVTQASLCDELGADTRTANLPGTVFFAMTAVPALIAWLSPKVSSLKRNVGLCYTAMALVLAVLPFVLASSASSSVKLGMVVLQAAVAGSVMPAATALLWEAVSRGSDESRRGLALGLAFGAGPILAVVGSFCQTALLGGDVFGWHFEGLQYPRNFIILFRASAPVVALGAVLSQFFIIPPVETEPRREPVSSVIGLLIGLPLMCAAVALIQFSAQPAKPGPPRTAKAAVTGAENKPKAEPNLPATGSAAEEPVDPARLRRWLYLRGLLMVLGYLSGVGAAAAFVYHFRSLLQQRVLLIATVVTVLVYAGNVIPANMNLYSEEVLGIVPSKYAGVQNMLRFSFKVVAGITLGWILTRTNPRTGLLVTAGIFLLSQLWAMRFTGPKYLIASGFHGAGELIGVYAPNYIVCASRQDQLRRNTAFMTMLMVPAAPAGYLYGAIVDGVEQSDITAWGMNSTMLGFRLSFLVCSLFILSGIILAATMLPAKPTPEPLNAPPS